MSLSITIRRSSEDDVPAITRIYNEAIANTTATFDTEPKSVADRLAWVRGHDDRHPVLVVLIDGRVVGWAALTAWSDRAAYDLTAETSFYVEESQRGKGVGRQLKSAIIAEARTLGYHTLIARVAEGSEASAHLNRQAGFKRIGVMREVGRKFGRLLDVEIFQLMLPTDTPCTLRSMAVEDLESVSALGIRSKASWGYDAASMSVFAEELTLSSEDLRKLTDAQVALVNDRIVGYFTLRGHGDGRVELEHLFVDPSCFGRGIGRRLLCAALEEAKALDAEELTLIADPNSTGFYQKHGARIIGQHATSISGRHIPVMAISLRENLRISSEASEMDVGMIHGFLSQSYWAKGRPIERVVRSLESSIPFALFHDGKQIAFARVLSDEVALAYLMDVFVLAEYERRGYASMLVRHILNEPRFSEVGTWLLKTRDAQGLYAPFGFVSFEGTERWMQRTRPGNKTWTTGRKT